MPLNTEELFNLIMKARTRVYQLAPPTPLERYPMPGGWDMLLKREDLSPIHSYKWRGAYNFMKERESEAKALGVAAASVGNHGQGVALAAARLGLGANVFLPKSAPRLNVEAVAKFGGAWVETHQAGDDLGEAEAAAHDFCRDSGAMFVPSYDDPLIMAGDGVLGDEMMLGADQPDTVFVQIGGGGLAAGVAAAIKTYDPAVRIIGVEEGGQASMKAAFDAGGPVTLGHVDVFCEGTAVNRAGELPFAILRELLDDLVTVSVSEVCGAIQALWHTARALSEPSGAMGLAAARQMGDKLRGHKVGVILTGANIDFRQLAQISRQASDARESMPYYRVKMEERPGAVLDLLRAVAPLGLNISYLMSGQNDRDTAYPIFGFDGPAEEAAKLEGLLAARGYEFQDVSDRADLNFRVAPFQPHLFKRPFGAILHFPERAGALMEFLERVAPLATFSYFNYLHTGEQVGRAMVVVSFESDDNRAKFLADLEKNGPHFTALAPDTMEALGVSGW